MVEAEANGHGSSSSSTHDHHNSHGSFKKKNGVVRFLHSCQVNAVPLVSGIILALLWGNLAPYSYDRLWGHSANTIVLFGPVRRSPAS